MGNAGTYHTNGLSRNNRFPAALRHDFFQADERDIDDMLVFITSLAGQFNYYNTANKPDGTWEDFFLSDINILTRVIAKRPIKHYLREYDRLKNKVKGEEKENRKAGALAQLINFITSFANLQLNIHGQIKKAAVTQYSEELEEFRKITGVHNDYDAEIQSIVQVIRSTANQFGPAYKLKTPADLLKQIQQLQEAEDLFNDQTSLRDKMQKTLDVADNLFSSLAVKYNRLGDAAVYYLHKQKKKPVSFAPHIGLLLTFLDLYQYLKADLNQLTKRHLDFFYKHVLGMHCRSSSADKVNMVFELNPTVKQFLLPKGEQVLASVQGQVNKDIFELDGEILLNQAKIRELKTLYVSENIKIRSKKEDTESLVELKVYSAQNPVTEPADFLKPNNGIPHWPVLGEDQADLPNDAISMMEAPLGLVVASPLLYAVDGKRLFKIRFYIDDGSLMRFAAYANNFAELAKRNDEPGNNVDVFFYDMLNKAFVVDISGTDKWIRVDKYVSGCSRVPGGEHDAAPGGEEYFQVEFELNPNDPAVGIYDPQVHGDNYDCQWPLVKLSLNNNSSFNPYTYLNGIRLERVSVKVQVSGSTQLKIQNNIGPLSTANPFQVYGPQPATGAYIDLKNTNIFNRFTSSFTVRFNWFNLPKEKGGFETYYQGYDNHITNDSFKVAISGLNEGKFVPESGEEQVFCLFSMKTKPGMKLFLDPETRIGNIDFNKIRFDNDLLLSQEAITAETNFKTGAVRIELVAPADAFAHNKYPVIFPKVIMHNAKRFVRDLPVPNQPFVPVASSVSVDYTLEQSEIVTINKKEKGMRANLGLWHLYPFGFKDVYPSEHSADVTLIPSFDYEGNLCIGLSDIMPGKVLSFLFQLEENNFLQVENETEPVVWSYLAENEWQEIPAMNILQDDTYGFISTGIVKLKIPAGPVTGNTILNPSLYWLRASCRSYVRSKVKAVFTQVASLTRKNGFAADNSVMSLPAGSIREFAKKIPQVTGLVQPFASFNGKPAETEEEFYTRVSEQLRHKQRLLSSADISQKILEMFPEIHKVICCNNTAAASLPGSGNDLEVVIIPRISSPAVLETNPEPKVNLATLYNVRRYLLSFISPFLKVEVRNPEYEKVKVVCRVVFNQGKNIETKGNNILRLNADIRKFISPWFVFSDKESKNSDGLYPSEILNFIKRCAYVSYVTDFTVLHFFKRYNPVDGSFEARLLDTTAMKLRVLRGSVPGAILISSEQHAIFSPEKQDEMIPPATGIGGLVIGNELLINNPGDDSKAVAHDDGTDDEIEIQFNHNS